MKSFRLNARGLAVAGALACVTIVAACASGGPFGAFDSTRGDQALAARSSLAGISEGELLACAGVPNRTRDSGGITFFTYENGSLVDSRPSSSGGLSVGVGSGVVTNNTRFGVGVGVPLGRELSSNYCEATFQLVGGIVRQLNYSTPTSGTASSYNSCYDIVSACIDAPPPAEF
ncbi:MAG: hypothetical protein AAF414_22960 [Pseudomonadota bacterium]